MRVIPCLLLHKGGLYKSVKFSKYKYVGDPINVVKIFNEKEADELAVIDIDATRENRRPDIEKISSIVSEAFMPIAYGGGISTIEDIKEVFRCGVEKIIINKTAHVNPNLISQAARLFGSQSIVVSIDVRKNLFGTYKVYIDNGRKGTGLSPEELAKHMEEIGAGEILLNNIDRDGTYKGYDLNLIKQVTQKISIPLIALGGAGSVDDFIKAKQSGASGVSAASMFIFQRPHQAVLISYPSPNDLRKLL